MECPTQARRAQFTSTAFQTATPWVNTIDRIHPNALFSNPFPSGYVYPPGSSQGLLSAVGLSLQSAQPSTLRTPTTSNGISQSSAASQLT